jgi:ATP-grasp domain-containing protein
MARIAERWDLGVDILVICPDADDAVAFASLREHRIHLLPAELEHWRPSPRFDTLAYLEAGRDLMRRRHVDAVVSTHDLGDLIAALLAAERGLPGPSPEAVFLCLHKLYGRRRESRPIRSEPIDLHDPEPRSPVGYPCFLKPPWLKLGLLSWRVEGPADLARALAAASAEYAAWARIYQPLFAAAVDVGRYPLAMRDVMLVEELVEAPQVTVEGWMEGDAFHLWAITDTNTFPGGPVIESFTLPSRYPAEAQSRMAARAEEAARAVGFRDGFFNAEMWWRDEGPLLTEINGRAAVCFGGLYEACLGQPILEAVVTLAGGGHPGPSPAPRGIVGGQYNFVTFAEGRVADFIDVEAARATPNLWLLRDPAEHIRPVSAFGVVLAQVELYGQRFEQLETEADRLRHRLLRRPEASPWPVRRPVSSNLARA